MDSPMWSSAPRVSVSWSSRSSPGAAWHADPHHDADTLRLASGSWTATRARRCRDRLGRRPRQRLPQRWPGRPWPADHLPGPHSGYDDIEIGDVSGDGRDDIVVMSGQLYATPNVSVARPTRGGGFGAPSSIGSATRSTPTASVSATSRVTAARMSSRPTAAIARTRASRSSPRRPAGILARP